MANCRYFHTNEKVYLDLAINISRYIKKLTKYGIGSRECGYGVTATTGNGGKVFLLRVYMYALPMLEKVSLILHTEETFEGSKDMVKVGIL